MENRTQQCSVFGSLSDSSVLTCCVPQGTILGPLLLFLYILNDLPNCLSDCEPRMYADDMQTYSKCDQTRIYAERIWPKAKYPRCFPISDNDLVLGLNRLQLQNLTGTIKQRNSLNAIQATTLGLRKQT